MKDLVLRDFDPERIRQELIEEAPKMKALQEALERAGRPIKIDMRIIGQCAL